MAFGGGPPALSLLTGLARGVTDRRQREQEAKRQALMDRLRNAQIERTEQAMRHDAAEETRMEAQERRARTEAIQEQRRLQRAAALRAAELTEWYPDMDPETATQRAVAEISGDLDPIPHPNERRKGELELEELEQDIEHADAREDRAESQLDISRGHLSIAQQNAARRREEDREREEEEREKEKMEQRVNTILEMPDVTEQLLAASSPEDLETVQRTFFLNPPSTEPVVSMQELREARSRAMEHMGGERDETTSYRGSIIGRAIQHEITKGAGPTTSEVQVLQKKLQRLAREMDNPTMHQTHMPHASPIEYRNALRTEYERTRRRLEELESEEGSVGLGGGSI